MSDKTETEAPAEAFKIELLDDPANNPFYTQAVATVAQVKPGTRFALSMPDADAESIQTALRLAANASGFRLYDATPKDHKPVAGQTYKVWKLRANSEKPEGEKAPAKPKAPKAEAPVSEAPADAGAQPTF